jgi:hypothetical protein
VRSQFDQTLKRSGYNLRRRFVGTAAMTLAAAQFAFNGTAFVFQLLEPLRSS